MTKKQYYSETHNFTTFGLLRNWPCGTCESTFDGGGGDGDDDDGDDDDGDDDNGDDDDGDDDDDDKDDNVGDNDDDFQLLQLLRLLLCQRELPEQSQRAD